MKKILKIFTGAIVLFVLSVMPAFAHVVVSPASVGVAAFQTFTVGVPNEKDMSIVSLRLIIPDGLKEVSPNVQNGWAIDIKKSGSGDSEKVTEIDWTGGNIPAGQRDDFMFNAQVPATETTLNWKAYQTYENGDVVSWDQSSSANLSDADREKMEKSGKGPYSQTKIINDLKTNESSTDDNSEKNSVNQLSIIALALSAAAIAIALRKK